MKVFDFFGSYQIPRPFILKINSGADSQITIPTDANFTYNYSIKTLKVSDSSQIQSFTSVTGNQLINFADANTDYFIKISGFFPTITIDENSEKLKFLDIIQFGSLIWSTFDKSFFGSNNLIISATDFPNLTIANNTGFMLSECGELLTHENFNMSNITISRSMYAYCSKFNPASFSSLLENIVNAGSMFRDCDLFNPSDFSPTLENLTIGGRMFINNNVFNPPNFNPNFKSLIEADFMFQSCINFDQDIIQNDSINGTVNLKEVRNMFNGIKSRVIKLQAGNIDLATSNSFNCALLEELQLIEMSISFTIEHSPLLAGFGLNNLANSVKDMTGLNSPTVTMLSAQYSSTGFTPSLFTNKNWTISQV